MSNCTVIIHTPQEFNQSSYLQTGLFEMGKMGLVEVKVQLSIQKNIGMLTVSENGGIIKSTKPQPKTSIYTLIDNTTNKKISFATDLYDHAEHFSEAALTNCDYYFKRNFESSFVTVLNDKYDTKILPLGLSFRVKSEYLRGKTKFKWGMMLSNLLVNFKIDSRFVTRLKSSYKTTKNHIKKAEENRSLARFEHFENKATTNTILFQTRCFLHEDDVDVRQIHQQRYHIIKLLRQHFPDTFKGGFVLSKIANQNYGDALTNVPTAPEEYLDAMKTAKIVIYTRGLANSPAWKMAEYLSQGKVIIAEPLTAELPNTLQEGVELLYFNNDEELIEKIKLVLKDDKLAEKLSKNARTYFEKHVHPVANTKRILEAMLCSMQEKFE